MITFCVRDFNNFKKKTGDNSHTIKMRYRCVIEFAIWQHPAVECGSRFAVLCITC